MEADACGICNGNNSLATFVSDSSSEVINFGTYIIEYYMRQPCVSQVDFYAIWIKVLLCTLD